MSFKPGDVIATAGNKRKAVVLAYHEASDIYPIATVVYMYAWGWIGNSEAARVYKTGEFIEPMKVVSTTKSPALFVGDEIVWSWAGIDRTGCITRITNNGLYEIFDPRFGANCVLHHEEPALQNCHKTGRHFDVSRVLKELDAIPDLTEVWY